MFILSAFADEISPNPEVQLDVLDSCGIRHIEFRSILGTNVLALTDDQVQDFKALLERRGFGLSAIGSPIGKVRIDEPFAPHLEKFQRALALCKIFGTRNVRIFSYYPPENFQGDWSPWRDEVLRRMTRQCELAADAGVRLIHENEHRIYGDDPTRIADLMTTLRQRFGPDVIGCAYDPANYVYCGFDPWDGWQRTKEWTVHFHIKDWLPKAPHGSLPGEGAGRIPDVIADAVRRGYHGFATMEPHLLGGGPMGGQTGPELFPKAVAAFKKILEAAGAQYS
ncbi:MAG: sugar phosphate isomerase/epimerase [Gemmataceae bacterium]|nr:sugar phosphate isomerase/epimerase [Gemmataceae bacterium]